MLADVGDITNEVDELLEPTVTIAAWWGLAEIVVC